jgi:hypothetical protein
MKIESNGKVKVVDVASKPHSIVERWPIDASQQIAQGVCRYPTADELATGIVLQPEVIAETAPTPGVTIGEVVVTTNADPTATGEASTPAVI